jgi:hypothetical protein
MTAKVGSAIAAGAILISVACSGAPALPSATAPSPLTATPPSTASASPDDADWPDSDPGIGETILLVVGAAHPTQADADAAALGFGDMQGFYVDVSDNYLLLDVCDDAQSGPGLAAGQLISGQWLELSAFRTWDGTLEFMDLVEHSEGYGFGDAYAGAAIYLVEKLGGPYVGLGMDGPLDEPPNCG